MILLLAADQEIIKNFPQAFKITRKFTSISTRLPQLTQS